MLRAFPPAKSPRSSTTTSKPRSTSSCAALIPATPPPRTTTLVGTFPGAFHGRQALGLSNIFRLLLEITRPYGPLSISFASPPGGGRPAPFLLLIAATIWAVEAFMALIRAVSWASEASERLLTVPSYCTTLSSLPSFATTTTVKSYRLPPVGRFTTIDSFVFFSGMTGSPSIKTSTLIFPSSSNNLKSCAV